MSLATKTVLGFLNLAILMAAALFLPAWTFDYWQAWVFLGIFLLSSALITNYLWRNDPKLLERRVKAGPTSEKEITQKFIQTLASIAFLGILIVPSLDHKFRWSVLTPPIVPIGDILIVIGFYVVFLVFRTNTFSSATIEVAEKQRVISSGPYSIVRHPMYAGALLLLLGTPLALASWFGLLMFFPMMLVIVIRLLDEEKFLRKELSGYSDYCSNIRYRLIPFIW